MRARNIKSTICDLLTPVDKRLADRIDDNPYDMSCDVAYAVSDTDDGVFLAVKEAIQKEAVHNEANQ